MVNQKAIEGKQPLQTMLINTSNANQQTIGAHDQIMIKDNNIYLKDPGNGDPTNDLVINGTDNNAIGFNQNAGSHVIDNSMLTLAAFDTPTGTSHRYKLTYQVSATSTYLKVRPQAINNFFAFEISA